MSRTIAIETTMDGLVITTEPRWCTGAHDQHSYRADIFHASRPFSIHAGRPRIDSELLSVVLASHPFSERPGGRAPYLAVCLGEGEAWEADLPEVLGFAVRLTVAGPRLAWAGIRARLLLIGGGR